MNPIKQKKLKRRIVSVALTFVLVTGLFASAPLAASAAPLPENASDVGVYTNGESHVNDIGDPTYNASYVGQTEDALAPGVPWTAGSMYGSIFEKDKAAGGTDYYLDRVLGVKGALGRTVLQTRGRSLYMRGESNNNFNTMGFRGNAFAGGGAAIGANLYTITLADGQGADVGVTEINTERFNAPSHAKVSFNVGTTGVRADTKKFITFDNVAVTTVKLTNTGDAERSFQVRAQSAAATGAVEDANNELRGTFNLRNNANNSLPVVTWGTATIGLKAKDFTVNGTRLERDVTIPAGGSVEFSVVGSVWSEDLPDSCTSFREYADLAPDEAFRKGVTAFNERWAADIPYIDVPDPAVEKAIVYRWWGERYNSLDTNESGYAYQFPVTIEGVNLYQNAIVLTQPMHLQDTKWQRTPYLAYGQVFNVGELSGSSAFLDSPGHGSWNNHYSQYIGTAGLEAYYVHGGGKEIAEKFGYYFENDGKGQLEHYDGNGNNLIAYTANYMPGNDADALTFGYPRTGGTAGNANIERPESAYVWGDFDAAAKLYALAGVGDGKVSEMNDRADTIKSAILDGLWNDEMKMFLAKTTRGAQAAASRNNNTNPLTDKNFIPVRESNLYDVYAQNLIAPEDYAKYVDGFRFLTYGDNHPIFPFYTANQYDKTRYNIGGSNNFSNINFTVQYRAVRSALRYYDPDEKYLDTEYARRLLDWMAWSIYPNGDLRAPNQAEYYSNWNAANKTYNRNNPNHVMLGNMNYIYVEDMGGILPRGDDVIELWPIDMGYDSFMVNNLRYHGNDVTIVWDRNGSAYGLGAGYSLFINGDKKVTVDGLGKFTYNPNTNEVVTDLGVTYRAADGADFPTAVDTDIEDSRVIDYMKKAGIDMAVDAENLALDAEVSASFTQVGARPAAWRNFHTPGLAGQMNYDPGSVSAAERPASVNAVNDNVTVNEPYWGNYGTPNGKDYVELDFGSPVTFDNVQVYFYNDGTPGGYVPPQSVAIFVPDGDGGWEAVPTQSRESKTIKAKRNDIVFEDVTAEKMRVGIVNKPGNYTAITEIQVFDSDKEPWEMINEAPAVTLAVNGDKSGNNSTELVAAVSDDGMPFDGNYTYKWLLVSAPSGANARIVAPTGTRTMVLGNAPGEYVFKFEASDGALTSENTITAVLAEKTLAAEFGANATVSSTGCASWENQNGVKGATNPARSNTAGGWGTWGQARSGVSEAAAATITYAWDAPVTMTSTSIYWYDDNGGTRAPRVDAYRIEYSLDGENWIEPAFKDANAYTVGIALNRYNPFEFASSIEARYLRVTVWGVQGAGAGTGIVRWRVYGNGIESVDEPVLMRVVKGSLPQLPETLGVVYTDGTVGQLGFEWGGITPDMVAEVNVEPFSVFGYNAAYALYAEAQIYVRPEDSAGGISITGVDAFERTITLGQTLSLPTKVKVAYNDGSRDNRAHDVTWDFNPDCLLVPGVYEIQGELSLPSYVGATDAKALLVLTVEPNLGNPLLNVIGLAIAEANSLDRDLYVPASLVRLDAALAAATEILFHASGYAEDAIVAAMNELITASQIGEGALVFRADKDGLAQIIAYARALDLTNVIPAAKANVETKLAAAVAVFDDDGATQDEVDAAMTDLAAAIGDLPMRGDKTALRIICNAAVLRQELTYTAASWAPFKAALDEAGQTLDDENATASMIEGVYGKLTDAMSKLVRAANFDALKAAIAVAQGVADRIGDYAASTVVGLVEELNKAKTMVEVRSATAAQISAQLIALNAKIGAARLKEDKSALLSSYQNASALNTAGFAPAGLAALTAALDRAAIMLSAPEGAYTQSQIDAAVLALQQAVAGLVRIGANTARNPAGTSAAPSAASGDAAAESVAASMGETGSLSDGPNAEAGGPLTDSPGVDATIGNDEVPLAESGGSPSIAAWQYALIVLGFLSLLAGAYLIGIRRRKGSGAKE